MSAVYRPQQNEPDAELEPGWSNGSSGGTQPHLQQQEPLGLADTIDTVYGGEGTVRVMEPGKSSSESVVLQKRSLNCALLGIALIAASLGFLIGYFGHTAHDDHTCLSTNILDNLVREADANILDDIKRNIDTTRITQDLSDYSQQSRLSDDSNLLSHMKRIFRDNLDTVETSQYEVLVSKANLKKSSYFKILRLPQQDSNLTDVEEVYKYNNLAQPSTPYVAYSANGSVRGDVVYANYGKIEHFETLKKTSKIELAGKIAIIRFGIIHNADKIANAELYGISGVILYADPSDMRESAPASSRTRSYQDTWGDGDVQWASLLHTEGDPLTPTYPAYDWAYRRPVNGSGQWLPRIPVLTTSYSDVRQILRRMRGTPTPAHWKLTGGADVDYRMGPGLQNGTVEMSVNNVLSTSSVQNICGDLTGHAEPDRWVILGTHYDSWHTRYTVSGAGDGGARPPQWHGQHVPVSTERTVDAAVGTALLLETVRVFGQLAKHRRWRPRRTLKFCVWGGRRLGMLGSTEWVEDYLQELRYKAVAYINIDNALEGTEVFRAVGSPLLSEAIFNATKKVSSPRAHDFPRSVAVRREERGGDRGVSVYEEWQQSSMASSGLRAPSVLRPAQPAAADTAAHTKSPQPRLSPLSADGDYNAFLLVAGIPSLDLRYTTRQNGGGDVRYYPVMPRSSASGRGRFNLVDYVKQLDPGLAHIDALTQVIGELLRSLGDELVLPLSVPSYASLMASYRDALTNFYQQLFSEHRLPFTTLRRAVTDFTRTAHAFSDRLARMRHRDPQIVRMFNDQQMYVERYFIYDEGLPQRHYYKHMILSPIHHSHANLSDSGTNFPGLLYQKDLYETGAEHGDFWSELSRQMSILIHLIQSAARSLREQDYGHHSGDPRGVYHDTDTSHSHQFT